MALNHIGEKIITCFSDPELTKESQLSFFTAAEDFSANSISAEVDVVTLTLIIVAEAVLVAEVMLVADLLAEEEDVVMELCSLCNPSLVSQCLFTCSFTAM